MPVFKKIISISSLILGDTTALLVSFLIAFFLRSTLLLPLIPRFKHQPPLPLITHLKLGFLYGALVIVLVFAYAKLYTKRSTFWDETKHLIKNISVAFVFITVLVFVSRQYIFFSRAIIVLAWMLSLIIFPLFRLSLKNLLVKSGLWKKRVIILGTNEQAKLAAQGIRQNTILGYEVMGFLAENREKIGEKISGVPILGSLAQLKTISHDLGVKDYIIALSHIGQRQMVKVMEECDSLAETIRIIPGIGDLFSLGVTVENLGDILSLNVPRNLLKPANIIIKTIFDYLLVLILSPFFIPLFLMTALVIKIDSTGPIFFIQERLGKQGKIFSIIKFRSMYTDGDQRLSRYLKENPPAKKEWDQYQKLRENDPRVTKVGKFIRKWSIDELPQLLNVLKGEMSFVGPRPYLPREMKEIGKRFEIISRVKPGLTGFWQVKGRSLIPFQERLLLDEFYIRNWSLWLDIVILFKTIKAWFKGEGAF